MISNVVSRISLSLCFFLQRGRACPARVCNALLSPNLAFDRGAQVPALLSSPSFSTPHWPFAGQPTAEEFCLSLPQTTTRCDDDDLFCCCLCQRVRTSVLWKNMATNEEGCRQKPTLKFLTFHLRKKHARSGISSAVLDWRGHTHQGNRRPHQQNHWTDVYERRRTRAQHAAGASNQNTKGTCPGATTVARRRT